MDWRGALRARLKDAAPTAAERVDWGIRPQDAPLPDICLQAISLPREYHMEGPQAVQWARVQVDCRGLKFKDAVDLAEAVVLAMEQRATVENIQFSEAEIEGPVDRGEQTATRYIHRQQLDLMFYYHSVA